MFSCSTRAVKNTVYFTAWPFMEGGGGGGGGGGVGKGKRKEKKERMLEKAKEPEK